MASPATDDKSRGTAPPLVRAAPPALPTGGGAMRGIGEKFSSTAATGTGALSIPLPLTPARGFEPALALTYDSGAGNGPFGAGWRLAVPQIARKTEQQLPTYADGADTFVLSGAEDLVPVPGGGAGVAHYRPRVEAAFARIERHEGATPWWSATTGANVTSTYGRAADARVADPADPSRVFAWLLERTEDALGNVVVYEYVAEDLANVAGVAEQHRLTGRAPIANRYLKRVRYGNAIPGDAASCVFELVLDYGDHAGDTPAATPGAWPARADAFSTYRAGFEQRTYRLCRRALLFHRFPELGPAPCLVRSVAFTYDGDAALAHLIAVEQRGHDAAGALAIPALRLRYTEARPDGAVRVLAAEPGDLPAGVDGAAHQWVDLDGEGVAGVLTDAGGALYYRRNLGGGALGPACALVTRPSHAAPAGGGQQLMDLGGDGRLDLVQFGPPSPGYSERTDGGWDDFRTFAALPQVAWGDGSVRFLDLDGDGRDDLLITDDDGWRWYPSLGKDGFGPPRTIPRPRDDDAGPTVVLTEPTCAIVLADLGGDGLRDLVRVENGRVCYWPNLGHGRFGVKVTMTNAPVFDAPDHFEARRVLFTDVDGTGASDLVYAGGDGVRVWRNLAGNAWSAPRAVELPADTRLASVTAVDLLGTGTACLAWSSPAPADGAIRYVDLTGGVKPHLLAEVDNQLGATTRVRYAPSTKFYLADRAAGAPWRTQLGFPVHVVERVETYDAIRRVRLVSEYRYRDGYFDGHEREFRGFGWVEQRDVESSAAAAGVGLFADRPPAEHGERASPPVVTRRWFHTGAWLDRGPDGRVEVPDGLAPAEARDAYRALRGRPLRVEVLAADGSPPAEQSYLVTESGYTVRCLVPAAGGRRGVYAAHARETIERRIERDPDDPRVHHEVVLDVDGFGHVRRAVTIGYPRRAGAAGARAEQHALIATLAEHDVGNEDGHAGWYRHGAALESRTYELRGLPAAGDAVLTFAQIAAVADAAPAIAYEATPPPGPSKRLVERSLTRYYDGAAVPAPLAWGAVDARAIVYEVYGLAFTPGLLAGLYGGRVDGALLDEAGYRLIDGDWWACSGRTVPDPARFFLPRAARDPFGNTAQIEHDPHALVVTRVIDARGNATSAELDYRTLAARRVTDPDGNQAEVATDALGRVVAVWEIGNPARAEGDRPPGEPTRRLAYAFGDGARPSVVHTAAREVHGDPATRWQHAYAYSDGAGQVVMTKVSAAPGKAKQLDTGGACVEVDADPRWLGTGRTVLDDKGRPIKQYEPYFSATPDYEDEDALVCQGVTAIVHYDPIGRPARTEHPDGSVERVERGAWSEARWDRNDTLGDPGNAWLARAQASPDLAVRRAAALALAHAGTPAVTHLDPLGRAVIAVADAGAGELLETRTTLDIEGNPLIVWDPMGRARQTLAYGLLGQRAASVELDGGVRYALADVAGQPVRRWELVGAAGERVVRTVYDALRRPVEIRVRTGAGAEALVEHTVWGEDAPADPLANRRGRVYQIFDGAGLATTEAYDFAGRPIATSRRLAADHRATPDWSAAPAPALDAEVFTAATTYDALGRVVSTTAPDGSVTWRRYDAGGCVESVTVQVRGNGAPTAIAAGCTYDERGQRTRLGHGAAAVTSYRYDPLTFRLAGAVTTGGLRDLEYTHDAAGNLLQIADAAQAPVWWGGAVVDGTARFAYDPIYRLARAEGREHAAGLAGPRADAEVPTAPAPHPNDGAALIRYAEAYTYDRAGNLVAIAHGVPGAAPAWVQDLACAPGGDRLAALAYDALGNVVAMPHLARIDRDWRDLTQRADKGGGGAVYFTHDAAGRRVRKVWEHGATVDERIYLDGFEIYRQRKAGDLALARETLHVGDGGQRLALIETRTDVAAPAPRVRLQLADHLGSVALELDAGGAVISYEEFHPFGTSAYRAAETGAAARRYRYLGNERDEETGLDHHGARDAAPWLGRWLTPDPAGLADGTNPYAYARGNPIGRRDPGGRQSDEVIDESNDTWHGPDPDWQKNVPGPPVGPDVDEAAAAAAEVPALLQELGIDLSGLPAPEEPKPEVRRTIEWKPFTPTGTPFTPLPPLDDPTGLAGDVQRGLVFGPPQFGPRAEGLDWNAMNQRIPGVYIPQRSFVGSALNSLSYSPEVSGGLDLAYKVISILPDSFVKENIGERWEFKGKVRGGMRTFDQPGDKPPLADMTGDTTMDTQDRAQRLYDALQPPSIWPGFGAVGAVGLGVLPGLITVVPGAPGAAATQPNPPGASFPKYITLSFPTPF